MGFYVDVRYNGNFDFYYNMEAMINSHVANVLKIKPNDLTTLPRNNIAMSNIKQRNNRLVKQGSAHLGVIGSKNMSTGQIKTHSILDIDGICATVSAKMAQEVLIRAVYYCPKDTGNLAKSGRIEVVNNNECRVVFGGYTEESGEVPYAWFVHEFTWKKHKFPERAKFLTQAIYEVEKLHGVNWA